MTGTTQTDIIPLDSINSVPIAMIAGTADAYAPYATAQHIKELIGDPVKQFVTIDGVDHLYFSYASDTTFMNAVTEALQDVLGTGSNFLY